MSSPKKAYVIDTSVLMHDPAAIERFEDNIVVVPIWVIEELDKLKTIPHKGEMARRASRFLDAYSDLGNLQEGVSTKSGGMLIVDYAGDDYAGLPQGFGQTNDHRIILTAIKFKAEHPDAEVILVSKDFNMRLKANSLKLTAQDYRHDKVLNYTEVLYGFVATLTVAQPDQRVLAELCQGGAVAQAHIFAMLSEPPELLANQCCCLVLPGGKSILARYCEQKQQFLLVSKPHQQENKIIPINDEQCFAYALLTDPNITLVTLAGRAGTGKTLMGLLAGYNQLEDRYRQLVVYRPNIELGRPLGYLPGTLEEKFEPWMKPIFDNLILVMHGPPETPNVKGLSRQKGKKAGLYVDIEGFIEHGLLEISPINFIQGRTLHSAFVIVDEAQNLTPAELKIVIKRMGEGSKIVLTGDPEQIADAFLDPTANGLVHVIERMKGKDAFGHITMKKTERSRLAELGAELL